MAFKLWLSSNSLIQVPIFRESFKEHLGNYRLQLQIIRRYNWRTPCLDKYRKSQHGSCKSPAKGNPALPKFQIALHRDKGGLADRVHLDFYKVFKEFNKP